MVLSKRSLSIFKSIFLCCCSHHISIFKSSLIRPSSCICWRDNVLKTLWEVIQLEVVVGHTVHPGHFLRERCFRPHNIALLCLQVSQCDTLIPPTFNTKANIFIFPVYLKCLPFTLKSIVAEPPSPFKPDFSSFIWPLLVDDGHWLSYVNVHLSNHEIMNTKDWWNHFVCLVKKVKVEIRPELLRNLKHFAIETHICLLVCKHWVLFASHVNSCHRGMVGNLFSQIVKFVCAHLECFKKQWVKGFTDRAFSHSLWRNHKDCN